MYIKLHLQDLAENKYPTNGSYCQGRDQRDGQVCLSILQSCVNVCLHCGQETLSSDKTLDHYICFTLSFVVVVQSLVKVKVTQLCLTLWPHGLQSPWNSPGWNTGVGSLSLLQGPFPTQGLNPGVPHCRWILYQLSHQGSPRMLECVACPFSGCSQPRNRTRVSCIAGTFFPN